MSRLLIGMVVYESPESDVVIKAETLDFKNKKHRAMIARTAWWAMHEGHEMVTWPLASGEIVEHYDSREEVCQ